MSRRRGFTLVELLVVITIIMILAAILFPAVSVMRTRTLKMKTQAMMQKVSGYISKFKNDYGTYPPVPTANSVGTTFTWDNSNYETITTKFGVPGLKNWAATQYAPCANIKLYYGYVIKSGVATTTAALKNYIDKAEVALTTYNGSKQLMSGDYHDTYKNLYTTVADTNPWLFVDAWNMPLIYLFNTVDASIVDGTDANILNAKIKNSGSRITSAPAVVRDGLENEFELWSAGPDMKFSALRPGAAVDTDNITVTKY